MPRPDRRTMRNDAAMDEKDHIETDLVDLSGTMLADLPHLPGLDAQIAAARGQTARPRKNLGSSGPPGRAD